MTALWITSHVLLWIFTLGMLVVLAATIRQVGLIHRRIPPVGARMGDPGPSVGSDAPAFEARDLYGREVSLPAAAGGRSLLLFMTTTCSACTDLAPGIVALARDPGNTRVVVVCRGEESQVRRFVSESGLRDITVVASQELCETFQVSAFPYAVLVDPSGTVLSKGLVNHLEHLESLIDAADTGFESMEALVEEMEHHHRVHHEGMKEDVRHD
jgi:methylamine dehydrogenase accessory protein MauD